MAHTPEQPRTYVCTDCQIVHVGTVTSHDAGSYTYEAPTACGACEGSAFVKVGDWPHHDR